MNHCRNIANVHNLENLKGSQVFKIIDSNFGAFGLVQRRSGIRNQRGVCSLNQESVDWVGFVIASFWDREKCSIMKFVGSVLV